MGIRVLLQRDITGQLPLILDRYGKPIPCNETEERIEHLAEGLRRTTGTHFSGTDVQDDELFAAIAALHDAEYLRFLEEASNSLPDNEMLLFDHPYIPEGIAPDTPIIGGIFRTALESARTAIGAAHGASRGGVWYALCRPPGHHAGHAFMGGHCYLNNAALAVATLMRAGHKRVGLVDFDIHFGNGSADVLARMPGAFFGSIHGATDITYPYIPTHPLNEQQIFLPFSTPPSQAQFVAAVEHLVAEVLSFGATALVVSAGFDVIAGDPHGTWYLEPPALFETGRVLAAAGLPLCIVQEGGYNPARLAECAQYFAEGIISGIAPRGAYDVDPTESFIDTYSPD